MGENRPLNKQLWEKIISLSVIQTQIMLNDIKPEGETRQIKSIRNIISLIILIERTFQICEWRKKTIKNNINRSSSIWYQGDRQTWKRGEREGHLIEMYKVNIHETIICPQTLKLVKKSLLRKSYIQLPDQNNFCHFISRMLDTI